jgi:hypothetical protein
LYIISDNILGAFQPQHARHAQLRFGINFIIGSEKTKDLHSKAFEDGDVSKRERKRNEKTDKENREKEADTE